LNCLEKKRSLRRVAKRIARRKGNPRAQKRKKGGRNTTNKTNLGGLPLVGKGEMIP